MGGAVSCVFVVYNNENITKHSIIPWFNKTFSLTILPFRLPNGPLNEDSLSTQLFSIKRNKSSVDWHLLLSFLVLITDLGIS